MKARFAILLALSLVLLFAVGTAWGQTFPATATDQTPSSPLANPTPSSFEPRYISGFGLDNTYTVFYEDRSVAYPNQPILSSVPLKVE